MKLIEYQKETWRTCPDLGSEAMNLSHMVLGICSEYSEYLTAVAKKDSINLSEELADKFWYISNYCNFRNYSLSDLWDEKEKLKPNYNLSDYSTLNYFYCLAELQDIVKKNLAYGKEIIKEKEKDILLSLLFTLQTLWKDFDFDLEKSLENNINKLRIRFPDKFTEENALNRNLEAERKELEK